MEWLTGNLGKWLGGAIVAFLTVFSDWFVGRMKLAVNRADLRTNQFEEMARDLSAFLFQAELQHEYHERGFTDPSEIDPLTEEYNEAITRLRRKEFVYLSWVDRYWSTDEINLFEQILDHVKAVDKAVHALDDEGDLTPRIAALQQTIETLRPKLRSFLRSGAP